MAVINSLCIAGIALVTALLLVHRQHTIIVAATPSFCLLINIGALLMLTSNYFHTTVASDPHCAAQIWLLTMGFTLLFAPLFLKTFRRTISNTASSILMLLLSSLVAHTCIAVVCLSLSLEDFLQ